MYFGSVIHITERTSNFVVAFITVVCRLSSVAVIIHAKSFWEVADPT
jgi:hypothetical protein